MAIVVVVVIVVIMMDVVAIVVAVAIVVVRVVGVITVGVVKLASWMKGEQVASLTDLGPWPYPLSIADGNGPSLGSTPSLQRNKRQGNGVRNRHLRS